MHQRAQFAWCPQTRKRTVSTALQAYALLASSADKGAIRDLSQWQQKKESANASQIKW